MILVGKKIDKNAFGVHDIACHYTSSVMESYGLDSVKSNILYGGFLELRYNFSNGVRSKPNIWDMDARGTLFKPVALHRAL